MKRLGVFMTDGAEECEALLIVDLLRRAKLEVDIISAQESVEIVGSHKIKIFADYLIDDVDYSKLDAIFLPGGLEGTKRLKANCRVCDIVKSFKKENKLVAAVCAAPTILAENGLLKDIKATVYPSFIDVLTENGAKYCKEAVVWDNNIITGNALGACIDLAHAIISYLLGEQEAGIVLDAIKYKWNTK